MGDDGLPRLLAKTTGFEWDENKRRLNVLKHGIDFADAKEVCFMTLLLTPWSRHTLRTSVVT